MIVARLSLAQWLSPAFPTGAFAYSHGLEWAIAEGPVRDAVTLRDWLADVLEFGAGWQDAVLLVQALRPDADHDALADLARALQTSAGRMTEVMEQGAAFARTVEGVTGRSMTARPLPVAVGEAAADLGLPAEEVAALYLHAFISNLVSVAVRFVPLGQTEGQGVLAGLHAAIADIAARAALAGPDDLRSGALGSDLAAMRQETQDVRLWRS
jgi:urease accessory protein